jgi:hypothetical protein
MSMFILVNECQLMGMYWSVVEEDVRDVGVDIDEIQDEERRRSTPAKQARCPDIRADETGADRRLARNRGRDKRRDQSRARAMCES